MDDLCLETACCLLCCTSWWDTVFVVVTGLVALESPQCNQSNSAAFVGCVSFTDDPCAEWPPSHLKVN